ncbi:hypothetical protein N1851_023304 [Merluccius polli]|uniref:Uncharacterized protein n=1 Tax=Merluccius polli TaxID=89951 RepID=A0AA47MGG2_MERPO|nr:hypothetical protein N1851_023304 [Merluccius polli]
MIALHHRCAAPPSQSPISVTQARWKSVPVLGAVFPVNMGGRNHVMFETSLWWENRQKCLLWVNVAVDRVFRTHGKSVTFTTTVPLASVSWSVNGSIMILTSVPGSNFTAVEREYADRLGDLTDQDSGDAVFIVPATGHAMTGKTMLEVHDSIDGVIRLSFNTLEAHGRPAHRVSRDSG